MFASCILLRLDNNLGLEYLFLNKQVCRPLIGTSSSDTIIIETINTSSLYISLGKQGVVLHNISTFHHGMILFIYIYIYIYIIWKWWNIQANRTRTQERHKYRVDCGQTVESTYLHLSGMTACLRLVTWRKCVLLYLHTYHLSRSIDFKTCPEAELYCLCVAAVWPAS
jgi:hypothetical protein